MNEKTLKALIKSREKWSNIERGHSVDRGALNCALCHRFPTDKCTTEDGSETCPIALAGYRHCVHPKYVSFREAATYGRAMTEWAVYDARMFGLFIESLIPDKADASAQSVAERREGVDA